ncbi:MAG: hypothetical protein O7E52_22190 [Candidatus Poribacteria bacterium]|nr:hypothetical protein [Candidatus Poribacteria bacterium]
MVTVVIYGFNVLVVLMCSSAVGLLLLGAYQDGEYSIRIKAEKTQRVGMNAHAEETSVVPLHTDQVTGWRIA